MLTCVIRYRIDPTKRDDFVASAKGWNEALPRCGADPAGYLAPHEGPGTLAYGIYHIESLAADEAYRERLAKDPVGRRNYALTQERGFLRREDRTFIKRVANGPAWVA